MKKTIISLKKSQKGLSLVEIILALGIVGGVAAAAVAYAGRADAIAKRNEATTALSEMVSTVKATFGPSGTFAQVTPQNIIRAGILMSPFKQQGTTDVIDSPWGGTLGAAGDASKFAFVLDKVNDQQTCITLANTLARFATKVHVGAAAEADTEGTVSGGSVYKENASTVLNAGNLAVGCQAATATDGTAIAAEFR